MTMAPAVPSHAAQHSIDGRDSNLTVRYAKVLPVTMYNASGALVPRGSCVITSTANSSAFTTSTTADDQVLGVTLDDIPAATFGPVAIGGDVLHVRVAAGTTQGQYLRQSTTAGIAQGTAAPTDGTFGIALTTRDTTLLTSRAIVMTHPYLLTGGRALTVLDSTFTIQDDLDTTKQAQFQLSGITAGQTRTFTLPDVSDTLVTLGATQTLTAKSLTSPTLTGTVAGTPTWASSQAITLSTAAQPSVTSLGTLTGLTVAGFTDITTGGMRLKGIPTDPGVDAANVVALINLAAGSNAGVNDTAAGIRLWRSNVERARFTITGDAATIAGVVKAVEDPVFWSTTPTYVAFFDDSNSGRLILGGGARVGSAAGYLIAGATSGVVTVTANAVAGTWTLTLPANDGDAGQHLKTDGAGVTSWADVPYWQGAEVTTAETTTSTTYTDLATAGPAITMSPGATRAHMIIVSSGVSNNTAGTVSCHSVAIAGAAATDVDGGTYRCTSGESAVDPDNTVERTTIALAQTSGAVHTSKYRVTGGTGSFRNRRIIGWSL